MSGAQTGVRAPAAPSEARPAWSFSSVRASAEREPETAPPVVHEVLRSPGQELDATTRSALEPRLGVDFRRVRLHADERAARSAEAVGAVAYTVGDDVVFGRGAYQPATAAGRELIAHELAHVAQEGGGSFSGELRVGRQDDAAEREAVGAARRSTGPVRRPAARGPRVLRRTTLGSLLGAGGGALGGAILGGLLGGPIGAIVGGVVGLIGGAIAGEVATTKSRALTQPEIAYAKDVYVDSIDYTKIRITRDSVLALGAPRTIGNTIHLKSDWGHFKEDTLELTPEGLETLIHEMGHVWQYQNGGLAYIPESLIAQLKAAVSGGDRGGAYDWRAAHKAKTPWEEWNPEQQAEAIEDFNKLLRKSKAGTATPAELHELSVLMPYIEKVRRREGAPTYGRPEPTTGAGAGGTP